MKTKIELYKFFQNEKGLGATDAVVGHEASGLTSHQIRCDLDSTIIEHEICFVQFHKRAERFFCLLSFVFGTKINFDVFF